MIVGKIIALIRDDALTNCVHSQKPTKVIAAMAIIKAGNGRKKIPAMTSGARINAVIIRCLSKLRPLLYKKYSIGKNRYLNNNANTQHCVLAKIMFFYFNKACICSPVQPKRRSRFTNHATAFTKLSSSKSGQCCSVKYNSA